jgi:hypothetical protein
MATITVDVDVNLDEFDDYELVNELVNRGYNVTEKDDDELVLDNFDLQHLIELVDNSQQTWYTRRVRSKLMNYRWEH